MNPVLDVNDTAPPPLERIIEAMLFIGGAPLTAVRACDVVRGLTPEQFADVVTQLYKEYRRQNRPYRIQRNGEGWELVLRPGFVGVRDRMFGGRKETRLTQPLKDTLSLIAYRQPVTREEVESVRGADSLGLLRQLVRLGLVAAQRGEDKELRYVTTTGFLKLFSLRNLDDLPRVEESQTR